MFDLTVRSASLAHVSRTSRFNSSSAALAFKAEDQDEVPIVENVATQKPFSSLKGSIDAGVYKAIVDKPFGYKDMSPVQEAVLEQIDALTTRDAGEAKDLLVKAKTGTGKTLAFLIPAVSGHLASTGGKPSSSVGILVLSPTRELATQIAVEAHKLLSHTRGAEVHLFVGGASKGLQIRQWERARSRDVVVATPGRMVDMLESVSGIRDAFGESFRTLILDEADTLLDMGFETEIRSITAQLPNKEHRQTFLFSATVSSSIKSIARATLKPDNHLFIDTVPENESNLHEHVPQHAVVLGDAKDFLPHILRLIAHDQLLTRQSGNPGKTIIFLPTTKLTELVADALMTLKEALPLGPRNTMIYEIHSRKSQSQRDRAARSFREANSRTYPILVTSDVSARGVDYPGVTRVIQIGTPSSRDTYIHRVGRTGRAGKGGRGDLVLLPWEGALLNTTLKGIPFSISSVDQVSEELTGVAATTTLPAAFERERSRGSNRSSVVDKKFDPESIQEAVDNTEPADSTAVREAFMSLLGYYVPKADNLRSTKRGIVEGLQTWATDAMGMNEAPFVSDAFLQRIGGLDKPQRNRSSRDSGSRGSRDRNDRGGFRDREFSGSRDRFSGSGSRGGSRGGDRAPWAGRGASRGDRESRGSRSSGPPAPWFS